MIEPNQLLQTYIRQYQAASKKKRKTSSRPRHAAGGAEDLGRAAAHAERQVGRLLFEHLEADAGFLDHLDDLLRGQHEVDVRYAVTAEFLASGLI